jgi:diguanylate cyclase (GGDEF)-like protein
MAGDRVHGGSGRDSPARVSDLGHWRAFGAYCLIQLVLAAVALTTSFPTSGAVCVLMVVTGVTALGTGIVRYRPVHAAGWWLICGGTLTLLLAHAITASSDGLTAAATVVKSPAIPFALATIPLTVVGLTVLSHRRGAAGLLDGLDASMVAAATLLLSWLAVTNLVMPSSGLTVAEFLLPFGVIAVFAAAVKLLMSTGFTNMSLVLVVLSVAALLGSTTMILIPSIHSALFVGTRTTKVLWAASGALLGAAALHPSFRRRMRPAHSMSADLSTWRIVVFAVIAVLVPLGIATDLLNRSTDFDHTAAGVAGPVASAVVLLVLLVGRLAVTARLSDRHSDVLRQQKVALVQVIDQHEALQRDLAYRATHDPLTGLANRVVLGERLDRVLGPSADVETLHALLLLDLDGFKDVNDTYGHPVGDDLLTAVAVRLLNITPSDGLIARLGGDEFAMIVTIADPLAATSHGQDILRALGAPFLIDGHELLVSASVGLLLIDPLSARMTPSEALRDADLSLYAAKNTGKARIVVFEPRLRDARLERSRLGVRLRHALSDGEVYVQYQPIVDLGTRAVVAVEAMPRWIGPDGDVVPPEQFVPAAEKTGVINALGEHVLRVACAAASGWNETHDVAVAVNISGHHLADPGFVDLVVDVLAEHSMPAEGLILELTEASFIDTSPGQTGFVQLEKLRARGIRIAIDAFGTGSSSLSAIAELPVDIVKLDRAFVQGGGNTTAAAPNWAFVGAILQAIASLGLQAVAKGVETPQQDRALRMLGCRWAQGYLFAPPAPAAAIDRLVAAGTAGVI